MSEYISTGTASGSAKRKERVSIQAIARGSSDEAVVAAARRAAETATDFSWLSRGDRVFIKLASNSGNACPATTSPLAVRAMVGLLKERGAGKVIVGDKSGVQFVYQDNRGGRGSTRKLMQKNGLLRAIEESGAEAHAFEEAGQDGYFGDRTVHKSNWKGELFLPNVLTEVDHVVLLPRVSRHVLAGSTLGLKAAVGWLRDDSRLELHRDAATFFEKAAEINDAKTLRDKLRLTLTVADKVQTSFGPDFGFVARPETGLAFASESLVAHDMVGLGWLLYNREHSTPRSRLHWYVDPYKSRPGLFNRFFVSWIWGVKNLGRTENYRSVFISSVRTDPVLSRAASIAGGFPGLELEETGVPPDIKSYIENKAQS